MGFGETGKRGNGETGKREHPALLLPFHSTAAEHNKLADDNFVVCDQRFADIRCYVVMQQSQFNPELCRRRLAFCISELACKSSWIIALSPCFREQLQTERDDALICFVSSHFSSSGKHREIVMISKIPANARLYTSKSRWLRGVLIVRGSMERRGGRMANQATSYIPVSPFLQTPRPQQAHPLNSAFAKLPG
jgi:hypothetical protein